jgi:hypothetical protein
VVAAVPIVLNRALRDVPAKRRCKIFEKPNELRKIKAA